MAQFGREEILWMRRRLTAGFAAAGLFLLLIVGVMMMLDPMTMLVRATVAMFGFGMLGFVLGTFLLFGSADRKAGEKEAFQTKFGNVQIVTAWTDVSSLQEGMKLTPDVVQMGIELPQDVIDVFQPGHVLREKDIDALRRFSVKSVPVEGLWYPPNG